MLLSKDLPYAMGGDAELGLSANGRKSRHCIL
jgi:hypothetical protein